MMNDNYNYNEDGGDNDTNLLEKLKRTWLNEKFAPNLLNYEYEIVKEVMEKIEEKEELCSSNITNINHQFTANIYEMEIERLKYIIKCYLVQRIKKIDKFYAAILSIVENKETIDSYKLLSDNELIYCKRYKTIMDNYFKISALDSIPKEYQKFDASNLPKPFLNSFVFCKPREDFTDEYLIDDDTIDFKKSSIYFLKYEPIRPLVEGGKMDLL